MDSGLCGHFKPFTISISKSQAFLVPRSEWIDSRVLQCECRAELTELWWTDGLPTAAHCHRPRVPPKPLLPWHVKGRGSSWALSLPLSMGQLCLNHKYVKKILLSSNIVVFMHTLGGVVFWGGVYFYYPKITLWCQTNPRRVCWIIVIVFKFCYVGTNWNKMFSKTCVVSQGTKNHNWSPFCVDFNHLALITPGLQQSSWHAFQFAIVYYDGREILLSAGFPKRSEFSFIEQRSLGAAQQLRAAGIEKVEQLNKWRFIQSASSHCGMSAPKLLHINA